jgi:hypothetical protein
MPSRLCCGAHLLLPRADFCELLVTDVHEHHAAVLARADQQAVVVADVQPGDGALVALDLVKLPCMDDADVNSSSSSSAGSLVWQ